MIEERDEERHPAGQSELWNESYYFNFFDGRTQNGGFLRIGLQESIGKANVWCLLIRGGRKAYQRFALDLPCPEGSFAEGLTVGGLTFRMLEPGKRFALGFYDGDGDTELDLLWESIHPVKRFGESGPTLPENMASVHYEQSGKVTGIFVVKGEAFDFNGTGSRDHSWGVRDWSKLKGWLGTWPVFGDDYLFSCGRVFLPDGSELKLGFVFDGTQNLEIEESSLSWTIAEDGHTPLAVRIELTDTEGKSVEVEGKLIACFQLPYDGNILNEAMFEYRMEERIGYGLCEYFVSL